MPAHLQTTQWTMLEENTKVRQDAKYCITEFIQLSGYISICQPIHFKREIGAFKSSKIETIH